MPKRALRKYRLTLLIAALLVIWLAAGPQLIERIGREVAYTEGLPADVVLRGRLLYSQGFDGIWQLDLNSGEASQWWRPPEGGWVNGIAASPDGTRLAIAYAPPADTGFQIGTTDLYLSDVSSPTLEPVLIRETLSHSYRNPAWSPDGRWLYFSHLEPQRNEDGSAAGVKLSVKRLEIGPDRTAPEIVIEGAEQGALSPSGTEIVFLNFDSRTYRSGVWIASVSGEQAREIVSGTAFQSISSPRFTPDGRGIIFSASGGLQNASAQIGVVRAHGLPWDIWEVDLADNTMSKMTPTTLDGPWTAWSPDGAYLAVLAAEGVFVVYEGRFYHLADVVSEGEITWTGH